MVNENSDNPFLFYEFAKKFVRVTHPSWKPLYLIGYADGKITAIAPLMTRDIFGVRLAKFILEPYFSPDFLAEDRYRSEIIHQMSEYLLRTLNCKFVDLTLPYESPNLPILKKICNSDCFYFWTEPYMGHLIIPVSQIRTWPEFEILLGNSFKKKIRGIRKKIEKTGSWRIVKFQGEDESFQKILEIEQDSWKQEWRIKKGVAEDSHLPIIWDTSKILYSNGIKFKHYTIILEINNAAVAYVLVLVYKKTVLLCKTSYKKSYSNLSPGVFVWNAAVRAAFDEQGITDIDFQTDLPFLRLWSNNRKARVRVLIARGFFSRSIVMCYHNLIIRKTCYKVLKSALKRFVVP